jgi:secreted trypsin-like serine protease
MTVTRMFGALAALLGAVVLVSSSPAAAAGRSPSIVGGSPAPAGAWPSIAYLRGSYHDADGNEHDFACTGSVVAPQWIVTAAHCTFGNSGQAPQSMRATIGVVDFNDPAGQTIAVDRFVPNPNYDSNSQIGDVGLIHLVQPTRAPAMPLAAPGGSYADTGGAANAAGWGATDQDGTQFSSQLMQGYLQVRAPQECQQLISGFDPNTQVCAGTNGATGACFGDSGGPLTENNTATGGPALWGITSYGPQEGAGLAPCSTQMPAVYTWIPAYAGFIQNTLSQPAAASGSAPTPGGESDVVDVPVTLPGGPGSKPGTRTTVCRRAQAGVSEAKRDEKRALTRLKAVKRRSASKPSIAKARRAYRKAHDRRLRAVASASRRCKA